MTLWMSLWMHTEHQAGEDSGKVQGSSRDVTVSQPVTSWGSAPPLGQGGMAMESFIIIHPGL